uniref:Uncharacterized protein n=1 Tax=Physcomitrium patens TaxID=3218 RepID=A0A2K1K1T4_PHYPA|nr:hypothetical protein PHYPA_012208 [Physcomitrium patens]
MFETVVHLNVLEILSLHKNGIEVFTLEAGMQASKSGLPKH